MRYDTANVKKKSTLLIKRLISNIKLNTTIAGAHTTERFNRTLKEKFQRRLDAMGLDRDKW